MCIFVCVCLSTIRNCSDVILMLQHVFLGYDVKPQKFLKLKRYMYCRIMPCNYRVTLTYSTCTNLFRFHRSNELIVEIVKLKVCGILTRNGLCINSLYVILYTTHVCILFVQLFYQLIKKHYVSI